MAGFESTRHSFYGSKEAKKLGLKILPLLSEQSSVYVDGEKLDELRDEVCILLKTLPESDDYWPFRLNNILRAIDSAKAHTDAYVVIG